MSAPYMWVREYPGHFGPDGGEPPSTDFSDVEKPGYAPLYEDDLREELVAALKPFAKLGEIILAEAPAEAKTIVLFTSASGEKFSMQLDYFRAASRAAIAALAKSTP